MRPLLLLALMLPPVSQAQQRDAPSQAPIEERRARPRLRAGIGGGLGITITNSLGAGELITVAGAGVGFELGVQLNDRYALYARVVGDTVLANTTGYGAVLGEVGFGAFSIATGVGWMGMLTFGYGGSTRFIAVPIVLGFTPLRRLDTSVGHSGFHIWFEGAFVIPFNGRGTLGGYGGLKFGYVWG